LCVFSATPCKYFRFGSAVSDDTDASKNRGNFLELVELVKSESGTAKINIDRLPKNATYCSEDSQNELLECAANVIKQKITDEVKRAGMFAVIVDEARDVSKTEQMSICLRYVNGHEICERFLNFVTLRGDLCATALATAVAGSLQSSGLDLKLCVSQCYDGASVMSGEFNGVQAQFRDMCASPCIYVHCYAHRVNLVLVDTCISVAAVGDCIGLLQAVHNFVTVPTVRHDKFVEIQQHRNERVLELPLQSDTRWVCKLKAITAFKTRFTAVLLTLQFFAHNGKPVEKAEAKGLITQFQMLSTVFFLYVLEEVLQLTNSLSTYCQAKLACMSTACALVRSTTEALENMCNDETFDRLYNAVVSHCLEFEIVVPSDSSKDSVDNAGLPGHSKRNVVTPSALKDSLIMSTLGKRNVVPLQPVLSRQEAIQQTLRRDMFAVLDKMGAELQRRFSDVEPLLLCCDSLNPVSDKFLDFSAMESLATAYSYVGIDVDKLRSQAIVAKNMFLAMANLPDTPHAILQTINDMQCAFPDLVIFMKLALTIPVSSANAERSFSAMRRVKSYLRSTMSDHRLTNLCLLSIERGLSGELLANPNAVVNAFATSGKRRISLM